MSLPKFVSLLQTNHLYLSRLDLLNDPHEGSLPRALVDARRTLFEREGAPHVLPLLSGVGQKVRSACYVNCWALSDFESEAFWRLYSNDNDGVAVQTTYQRLVDVIKDDEELYVGRVSYLDYETQWFPDGNLLYPVMHKRLAFAHEKEVRLVKLLHAHVVMDSQAGPPGVHVPVNLEQLVEGVFVTPYAQEWYADVVKSVVEKFALPLAGRVRWSQMKSAPLY
ncbi:MAG: DUF2971 domain-containing protein [Candidatus Rokuibacteriota bacterium]